MYRKMVLSFILMVYAALFVGHIAVDERPGCAVDLEQLSDVIFLDTRNIPPMFDRETLLRLYDFLQDEVIANCRTPFPNTARRLPVVIRYVEFTEGGTFPHTTEGFAGWCDVVCLHCYSGMMSGYCDARLTDDADCSGQQVFIVVIAVPQEDNPDYEMILWGITAHELAHSLGAIDGPRYPFYERDHLLAPIDPVSDTYYWFGIAHIFKPGWQGIVRDAWHNTCHDWRCVALRHTVFRLE